MDDLKFTHIATSLIDANTGQIGGVPANPRQWLRKELNKLKKSLKETPELFEARGIIVYPLAGRFIVIGGNMRLEASRELGLETVPCIVLPEGTQAEKLKEIVIKDNGSFGDWDLVALSEKWGNLPLGDWGVPQWDEGDAFDEAMKRADQMHESEGYKEFENKFELAKTTDDCYTPEPVYDAVVNFVKTITDLTGKKIVRPFYPGGDYEHFAYGENSVVIDNPPFSILAKILRFYCSRNIPFFLFAPALTLFSARDCDLTYIISDSQVTYKNGAVVSTGFITNLVPDIRIWCCPQLHQMIEDAQPIERANLQQYEYPDNIVTAATLNKLARYSELKIKKKSCTAINKIDGAKEQGVSLFGGGYLISENAAAAKEAAAKEAAEKAAARKEAAQKARDKAAAEKIIKIELSDREKAIIATLE